VIKKAVYLETAPAKINLYLEVLAKEPQAKYHNIATVFQALDLKDFLTFEFLMECSETEEVEDVDFSITLDSNNDTVRDLAVNNSCVKAVESFFMRLPEPVVQQVSRVEVSIYIDKHIPLDAGLAGGSADAAATLRALNKFIAENFNCQVPDKQMLEIALELGSDVPFCLQSLEQPRAYAEGRGELFAGNPLKDFNYNAQIILVKPSFGVDTAEAYAALSPTLMTGEIITEPYFNRFEQVIFKQHPELIKIKAALLELGCQQVMLSGSGSTMIGFLPAGTDPAPIYQDVLNHLPNTKVFNAKMLT
jgi:4-diphosphocytidyl-2-C-methyl-D-erythritol kinase